MLSLSEGEALLQHLFTSEGELGVGGFGTVRRATRRTDGTPVALKLFQPKGEAELRSAREEAQRCLTLRHINVVSTLDSFCLPAYGLCLVMELCDGGDLARDISAAWSDGVYQHSPETLRARAHGLCSGLQYLHEKRVAHRDLKAANVLLHRGCVKIADLGSAKDGALSRTATQDGADTAGYRAPELLVASSDVRRANAFRADRWALGVVLAELAAGKLVAKLCVGELAEAKTRVRLEVAQAAAAHLPTAGMVVAGLLRTAPGRRMRLRMCLHVFAAPEVADSSSEGPSDEDDEEYRPKWSDGTFRLVDRLLRGASTRKTALITISKMRQMDGGRHVPTLVAILSDPDPTFRVDTVNTLGALGDAAFRSCDALCTLLLDLEGQPDEVRIAAAQALGRIDDVRHRLETCVDVRPAAEIGPVIDALIVALCNDPHASVRVFAMEALRKITEGAWRLSKAHLEQCQVVIAGNETPASRPQGPHEKVARYKRDKLLPLVFEAGRSDGRVAWPLERSKRASWNTSTYGELSFDAYDGEAAATHEFGTSPDLFINPFSDVPGEPDLFKIPAAVYEAIMAAYARGEIPLPPDLPSSEDDE